MQEPQTNSNPYHPVSCDFMDQLESYAVAKRAVSLKIQNDDGEVSWIKGHIKDIFTHEHAEFVKLEEGSEIRLDHILEAKLLQ